jgi:hypothetical protein
METKDQRAIRAYYRAYWISPEAMQEAWDVHVAKRPLARRRIVDNAHLLALSMICQGCLSDGHIHEIGTVCHHCGH